MNDFDTAGLVERAKAITLQPDATWPKIAAEQTPSGDILTRYALPLAAIGPIASFIGGQLFGITMLFATIKPGLMGGLTMAVTSFVMSLIALVIMTFIADFLAPNFGGQSSRSQAFKLVAYSMTPGWVAAGLGIIPSLSLIAALIGLYGLFLLYKGATPVMKVPQEKAGVFTAVAVVCAIVVNIITGTVIGTVTGALGVGAASMAASSGDKVEVNIPGVGKIDSEKMEQATKSLEGLANGEAPKPVDLAALQALLPGAIGAYQRVSIESTGVGGIGSAAEAKYKSGDKTIEVKIIDIAGLGGLAGALGGMGIEQNREDADSYERTRTVDGKIQTEKWDNKRSKGSYGTQVAGRFMVEVSGEAGSIDELKAVVGSIDQGKLEALAK